MSQNSYFSVVIPVYKATSVLPVLTNRLVSVMQQLNKTYKIIYVEDGSNDETWETIATLAQQNPNILGIKLSKNFGQHHAITAGLDYANSEWVIVMDCDLQDLPEEINKLYQKSCEGYDIIFARRNNRTDSYWKKISSGIFYKLYSYLTGIKYDGTIANFGLYSNKVITTIKNMREPMRAFAPMARWVGFSKTIIDVEHGIRFSGKTTYSLSKLLRLAFDIILSYSNKPLKLIIYLGFAISGTSFISATYLLYKYFTGKITVLGYTSIIISIWLLGGLIILILGVIGLYISKIFEGIKNRPLYIIDKTINL